MDDAYESKYFFEQTQVEAISEILRDEFGAVFVRVKGTLSDHITQSLLPTT